jgi:hypothetical protein
MVTQLAAFTSGHLMRLEQMVQNIDQGLQKLQLTGEGGVGAYVQGLEELRTYIVAEEEAAREALKNPVAQGSMSEGEVELF